MNARTAVTNTGTPLSAEEIKDIKGDRLAIVKLLVAAGADVNFQVEPLKMTALHWAAFNADIATCRFLIENGANIIFSTQDFTPVDIAGMCGYPELVEYFTETLSNRVEKPSAEEKRSAHLKYQRLSSQLPTQFD
jgi:ankyrin repeat protein